MEAEGKGGMEREWKGQVESMEEAGREHGRG
jgi:hypothetical protein